MSTQEPAGPIVDALGNTFDLDEGDFVVSALILAKVVDVDGEVSLCISQSEGLSWIDQNGLITSAQQIINDREFRRKGLDD